MDLFSRDEDSDLDKQYALQLTEQDREVREMVDGSFASFENLSIEPLIVLGMHYLILPSTDKNNGVVSQGHTHSRLLFVLLS